MRALLALYLCLASLTANAEKEWRYADLSTRNAEQITISESGIGRHRRVAAKICDPTSQFICFDAPGFRFAVPKSGPVPSEWEYGSTRFKVVGREDMAILGRPVELMWIEQMSGKDRLRFLYSRLHGLVGFQNRAKGMPLFVLENPCGFGASEKCVDKLFDLEVLDPYRADKHKEEK
jgi:hypothetical protein